MVRDVRDKDLTVEELVLQWEEPLSNIASMADITPAMSEGHDELELELITYVENQRNRIQSLEQEVESNILRLADMEDEISALDERLGGATAERAALVQRLEAEEQIKAQFAEVEKMFARTEARVFREGNNVILRLVGLTFDSGKAEIKQEDFDLLAKVERAIDVFPRSELIIEGHTDSYGGDASNQRLSQARAESVQQYMINAMRIPSYRLIATGFGETNPVANNETESGRARNRRIDIIIKPNLDPKRLARHQSTDTPGGCLIDEVTVLGVHIQRAVHVIVIEDLDVHDLLHASLLHHRPEVVAESPVEGRQFADRGNIDPVTDILRVAPLLRFIATEQVALNQLLPERAAGGQQQFGRCLAAVAGQLPQ